MRRLIILSVVLLSGCWEGERPAARDMTSIQVSFSPRGGCTQKIVDEIRAAKSSIYCQAYSFTSREICDALVAAHARNVDVRIILDKSQAHGNGSRLAESVAAGIPTWVDSRHAIAHNKIMIIDSSVVITGSFNFTEAAEASNAENLLVIRSPNLAALYKSNWDQHVAHSAKMTHLASATR